MATERKASGDIGENEVAAELQKRGYTVVGVYRRRAAVDIEASAQDGALRFKLQVKRNGDDGVPGAQWHPRWKTPGLGPNLLREPGSFWVFVSYPGNKSFPHACWIVPSEVVERFVRNRTEWVKANRQAKGLPGTDLRVSIPHIDDLEEFDSYREKWDVLPPP